MLEFMVRAITAPNSPHPSSPMLRATHPEIANPEHSEGALHQGGCSPQSRVGTHSAKLIKGTESQRQLSMWRPSREQSPHTGTSPVDE